MFFPNLIVKNIYINKNKAIINGSYIKYIFNDPLNSRLTIKELILFLFFCLLSVIYYLLIYFNILLKIENNGYYMINEYNCFLILFIFIISYIYKHKYYKHQYISIAIMVIIGHNSFIIRVIKHELVNSIFSYLFSIITSFLCAIVYIYKKLLMDFKYYSFFKCCYKFGIINMPIIILLYIIFTFIKCPNLDI